MSSAKDSDSLRISNGSSSRSSVSQHDDKDGGSEFKITFFVSNLAKSTVERPVEDLFYRHGKIERCEVIRDPKDGSSRGFAFVTLSCFGRDDREVADRVVAATDRQEIDSRRVFVERAKRDRPHEPTPGRYLGTDRRPHSQQQAAPYGYYYPPPPGMMPPPPPGAYYYPPPPPGGMMPPMYYPPPPPPGGMMPPPASGMMPPPPNPTQPQSDYFRPPPPSSTRDYRASPPRY